MKVSRNVKLSLLLSMALIVTGCQSKPEDAADADDMFESSDSTEAYGAGDRSGLDAEGAQAQLLSERVFYFGFDDAQLNDQSFEALKAHAQYLMSNTSAQVRLEGHADERGTREYNVALAERRGQAVSKFLSLQGVGSGQAEIVSYGEEKPVAMGHSDDSWSQNRRVEIVYVSGEPGTN
ncbi:MAG: peptidoglycan-associated lipoprotein Pal [Pseudomonadota bacterium]